MSQPTPKRLKLMAPHGQVMHRETAIQIAQKAMAVNFPWSTAVPKQVEEWIKTFALAHNTRPEFVFMGALVTTAATMGPKTKVQIRGTYKEPTNVYAICLADPGAGKSQAFRLSMIDPINYLVSTARTMNVDDYTRQGLFKHLERQNGRALVAQEEMTAFFDLVQKRQLEGTGERQLYCRLYDGGSWTRSTGMLLTIFACISPHF